MSDDGLFDNRDDENLSTREWAFRQRYRFRQYLRDGPEFPDEDQNLRYEWIRDQQEERGQPATLDEIAAILKKIQTDIADIRFDVVGERGTPHGPEWGGNLDERLWALTKNTAAIGWVISLLVGIAGILAVIAWRLG